MTTSITSVAGFGFDDRYRDGWESLIVDHESGPTGSERQVIPPRLDEMAPGPVLGTFLSGVDVGRLSGYDRVVVLRARQRMASHYTALVYTDMVSIADAYDAEYPDWSQAANAACAAAEIRSALHLTRRAADIELSFALDLCRRLPQVHQMLMSGLIDARRAKTIDRGTCHLSIGAARGVVERIAQAAPRLTTGELAARIKKLCIEADQDEATKRYKRALSDRRIIAEPTVDGTANLLGLDLPPDKVAAVTRRINEIARSLRGDGETRTMDQLRADVHIDLLQGKDHKTRSKGVINMTVDLDTLAGLADHPGELNGFTPVISDIARQVAQDQPDSEWRYTVTDTETGQPVHTGTTRRRPTNAQRRRIESRTRTCVFPGCRMPAIDSDLDHTTGVAEGGATDDNNLAPLCRNDHCLKHNGWTYKIQENGEFEWTSPLGHTYKNRRAPP
jgi:hypothetical protein